MDKTNDFVQDRLSEKFGEDAMRLLDSAISLVGYKYKDITDKEALIEKAKDLVIKLFVDSKFDKTLLSV